MSKTKIRVLLILTIVLALPINMVWANDVKGHWAQERMEKWYDRGILKGYDTGTTLSLQPDGEITRAEFAVIVNKTFGFSNGISVGFTDVKTSDWFYNQVMNSSSYMGGYPDGTFKPNNKLTREEASVVLNKVFELKTQGSNNFKDGNKISGWSEDAVNTLVSKGYITGYPDGTFQPKKTITRAEVITIMDKMVTEIYTQTPNKVKDNIKGNVLINSADITLSDTIIDGDLFITEGVGEGDVTLSNITVKGRTLINGGGQNSIYIIDCNLNEVQINKKTDKPVRVVIDGKSEIQKINTLSNTALEVKAGVVHTIEINNSQTTITTDKSIINNIVANNNKYTLNNESKTTDLKDGKPINSEKEDKKDDKKPSTSDGEGGGGGSSSKRKRKPTPKPVDPEKPISGQVTWAVEEVVEGLTSEFTINTDIKEAKLYSLYLEDGTVVKEFVDIDKGIRHLSLIFKDVQGMFVELYKEDTYAPMLIGKAHLEPEGVASFERLHGKYKVTPLVEGLTSQLEFELDFDADSYTIITDGEVVISNEKPTDEGVRLLDILLTDLSDIRVYFQRTDSPFSDFTFGRLQQDGSILF